MGDEMLNTVKAIKTALGGESGGETYGSELLNTVIEIKDLVENGGGGGGGGGLPSYTYADKGKFLGLGDADPVETVIVPEQTGEFIADFGIGKGFTVSNPNLAFFQSAELGDTCEAIVGGSSYTLTYADYNGTLAFLDGSMLYALVPIYVDTEVEEVEFVSTTAALHDTAKVSATATVASVEPKWGNVPTKYVLNIGWDDVNNVNYIEKSSLDYILTNSPDIIEISGDAINGEHIKNAVTNNPDYKYVCYSFSVLTAGATGIMITVPGIYYDDSEADSIFISEGATEDTSGQYPVWVSDAMEYVYNSGRNRYELS